LTAWRKGELTLISSATLIDELNRVLHYPHIQKLYKLKKKDIENLIWEVENKTIITPENINLEVVKNDPSDNRILEAAVEGEADYIISGDTKHLLPLQEYQGIKIITPAEFIDILGRHNAK